MRTYFRDFSRSRIEAAWAYAAKQSTLGHNVRFITSVKPDQPEIRVYFSAVKCNPKAAVDIYSVPSA